MSAKPNYAGGVLSFVLFCVFVCAATVCGLVLVACEAVWNLSHAFLRRRKSESNVPDPTQENPDAAR